MKTLDAARIVFSAIRRPLVQQMLRLANASDSMLSFDLVAERELRAVQPTIYHGKSGPYLARYDLGDGADGSHAYAHRFFRPDEDRWLHGHPWDFVAYTIHGYVEERWNGSARESIERKPGDWYAMGTTEYHRIDRLRDGHAGTCWSLVFTAPKAQKPDPTQDAWGFWMPETGEKIPWRQFIAAKGLVPASGGSR